MKRYYKGPISDHFDGTHFFNPWNRRVHSYKDILRWMWESNPKPWPKQVENNRDHPPENANDASIRISFVGHSTVLMQTMGMNILTDPVWAERASPSQWFGPKRVTAPGINFDDLPKISLILLSHNHYDHLDISTIKKLWDRDKPTIIAPLGNDTIIHSIYPEIIVHTLDWNQSKQLEHIKIHLEPVQHWSARNLWDRDKALWGSFVIETLFGKIYFAGDSGYGDGELFRNIFEKHGPFRLALLPIGAYEPRWFMKYAHMNAEEAVLVHKLLGEPNTMAIHHGTFHLSDEGYDDPIKTLYLAKKAYGIEDEKFKAIKAGEIWHIPL